MSAASTPPWLGSRVLLGWWRELLGLQPQQLWFGHFLVHRVEAPLRVVRSRSLDRWQRALLRLLGTRVPHGGDLENALVDLHVDRQVLTQLLRELSDAGLLHRNGVHLGDLTDAGRHVLETGSLTIRNEERRTLYFLDNTALHRPPHFVSLRRPPAFGPVTGGTPVPPAHFEIATLEACIGQTPEWKTRYHFPADVEALLPSTADWQRVVLDSLEPLALVLIRTAAPAGELLGFAVRTEGWALETKPILTLAESWEEVLPDLAVEPSPEAWRQAWRTWCQPRDLPPADVEACRLERADHRLVVQAPSRLVERLRAARSDAIKQEAWLLAGDGRIRLAAQIDLMPK